MSGVIKKLGRKFGIELGRYSAKYEQVVTRMPEGEVRGRVLLAYVLDPFLVSSEEGISHDHTHDWESYEMAQAFLRQGYAVDIISYLNRHFVPTRDYDYFVAAKDNFDRLAKRLHDGCVKVAHLETAHWLFSNHAADTRLLALQDRRGVTLANSKAIPMNWAIEHADVATILGNDFTRGTYAYANKPIYRIPISAPCSYDWDAGKDFENVRRNYLWFGSSGFVHKGLDLVLEAFVSMPEYSLTVCGPFDVEKPFLNAYHAELFATPNIKAAGWMDIRGEQFARIARDCVGLVYPTCSEGGGGSAITCMHAGLVPILSREASVDVDDCGCILEESSVRGVQEAVRTLSGKPVPELEAVARGAWERARRSHTREGFAAAYERFLTETLLTGAYRDQEESVALRG